MTPALRIEPGTLADYAHLAQFHYRSARAGAVTSVVRAVHTAPTAITRFRGTPDESHVVGVLVRSHPALSCRLRNHATGSRYGGLDGRAAAALLNREVRTISRVVIDPRFRGLGVAVRLVRWALQRPEPGVIFTEALAAMGRVCPFFQRAGMTRYEQPLRASPDHARLIDALQRAGLAPEMLASSALAHGRLAQGDPALARWLEHELRRWHRAAHRVIAAQADRMSLAELLRAAQRELLSQPVYYLFQHGGGMSDECSLQRRMNCGALQQIAIRRSGLSQGDCT